jgi:formylglycine-generating enzyme required for sulfatase activity
MVATPAGSFLMGSPADEPERNDDEGPQHQIRLAGFFLGRTPITQAQWKVVAGWEKVELDLNSDPANFKGPNRPVERVNWLEAVEFCRRLRARTGRSYTLPSEAQWEYACRAGTTTPFHCGATLTAELANYNASSTYGGGPKFTCRERTTDVGSFPANPWGLHDMHGNVWEWCMDTWHDSYVGAPEDGSAWRDQGAAESATRLLRGGSWYGIPRHSRSASRSWFEPDIRSGDIGFRVCCLPPGSSF